MLGRKQSLVGEHNLVTADYLEEVDDDDDGDGDSDENDDDKDHFDNVILVKDKHDHPWQMRSTSSFGLRDYEDADYCDNYAIPT